MKIGENKVLKINTFDLLHTESLEEYLSEMALEGWMISKVSTMFLTFKKTDPKRIKFFVDITDKDLEDSNYVPNNDYIDFAKAENLEHICGNEKFQIFINRGSKRRIDKRKLKFNKIFTEKFGVIMNIFFVALPSLVENSFFGESFIELISSNFFMIWIGLAIIIVLFNLLLMILKLIKYKKIMKEDNYIFNEVTYNKSHYLLNKYVTFAGVLFAIFTVIYVPSLIFDNGSNISKEEMPLSLEDFNMDIQEERECTEKSSSSPFAKYVEYSDYTYKKVSKEASEEENDMYYEEYIPENETTLSYSIFESKYGKVMDKALNSILNEYNKYERDYKKLTDKDELKNWGAKEVYVGEFINDRIVIYDHRIITIKNQLGYNKENINIIKSKILD